MGPKQKIQAGANAENTSEPLDVGRPSAATMWWFMIWVGIIFSIYQHLYVLIWPHIVFFLVPVLYFRRLVLSASLLVCIQICSPWPKHRKFTESIPDDFEAKHFCSFMKSAGLDSPKKYSRQHHIPKLRILPTRSDPDSNFSHYVKFSEAESESELTNCPVLLARTFLLFFGRIPKSGFGTKLTVKNATGAKTHANSTSLRSESNARRPGPGFGQNPGNKKLKL